MRPFRPACASRRRPPSRRGFLGGLGAFTLAGCAKPAPAGDSAAALRLPAEWEPHQRTLMVFPTPQNWEGCWGGHCDWVDLAREEWAATARAIAAFESVLMVANEGEGDLARSMCGADVEVVELPINDAWARDTGPLVRVDGRGGCRAAGFGFNAWGEKFTPWDDDAALKGRVCDQLGIPLDPLDMVLEGGAISVDGEGTLLATERCLLNENRNPGWTKAEVEAALREDLGVTTILWLADGTVPDPITDGHVDGICVFAAPGVVVLHTTDDVSDPNHAICEDARARLAEARDAKGRALEILELPLGLTVAHVNFYVANGGVVVPLSGDAAEDDTALGVIRDAFPGREVVGVTGTVMAEGGGGVHCITMQIPAA